MSNDEKHTNNLTIAISPDNGYKITQEGLTIPISPHRDKIGDTYYLGRLQCPGTINFNDGVCFKLSLQPNDECLQITDLTDNELSICRTDAEIRDEACDYIGFLKFPGSLMLQDGVTFLIFISTRNQEEIQIAMSKKRVFESIS